jgi:hypothetical protein
VIIVKAPDNYCLYDAGGDGEALEPADHSNQDIVDAVRLELIDQLEPELCAFALLDPPPKNSLLASRVEIERDMDARAPAQAS